MPDKETSAKTGYSQEDEYFKRQELAILAKKRAELDAARQRLAVAGKAGTHWMKCPKCGGDLAEVRLDNVLVDKCGGCGGVYFDKGEIELLLQGQKSAGLLGRLFG